MDCNFPTPKLPFAATRGAIVLAVLVCLLAAASQAQEKCIEQGRVETLLKGVKSGGSIEPNSGLGTEILTMNAALAARAAQARVARPSMKGKGENAANDKAPGPQADAAGRICQILNTSPWPGKSLVGPEAASAWMELVKTHLDIADQRALLPVVAAAVDRGETPKDDELAAFIDRIRLRSGVPQIFGTQATEQDGFLVLYPLESEQNIDAWRNEYGMKPLGAYIRALQNVYTKLVIRSTAKVRRVPVAAAASPSSAGTGSAPLEGGTEEPILRVDTSLVTIDATVSGVNLPKLRKGDFKVFEDGQEQEVTEFGSSDAPFDIVLLLDLSGSTSDKVGLIKKTTKRFVEMKRDSDRVAIITFNSGQTVVSPLEADKEKLFDRISEIKGRGSSMVWDSEKFAMDLLERDSPKGRRKAVVVMTDGIDNALFFTPGVGSKILFGDLLEDVRNSQISLFPIYLNPNGPGSDIEKLKDDARRTMQMLADASGGTFYTTANLDSLNEVYGRVLRDVGTVYSLGYQPKNDERDGSWREIRVEIPAHPDLKVRARAGYYAK